jgi:hypothetical protein
VEGLAHASKKALKDIKGLSEQKVEKLKLAGASSLSRYSLAPHTKLNPKSCRVLRCTGSDTDTNAPFLFPSSRRSYEGCPSRLHHGVDGAAVAAGHRHDIHRVEQAGRAFGG